MRDRNPRAAERVGRTILNAVERLEDHPLLGKPGRSPGTRELDIGAYPYLVVYSVERDPDPIVVILRVLLGAMLWPRPARA